MKGKGQGKGWNKGVANSKGNRNGGVSLLHGTTMFLAALMTTYIVLLIHQHQKHISKTSGYAVDDHKKQRSLFSSAEARYGAAKPARTVADVMGGNSPALLAEDEHSLPKLAKYGGNDRPRIIFAVPMPWPLKDDLAKDNLVATISTWGAHATRLVLVVSEQQIKKFPPNSELGEQHSQIKDYLYPVPMKRPDGIHNGRHIWEKMWRGWRMVCDKFRHEAEWFVKADLDTFVAVENMRAFLSHLDPDQPYYFGHTLFHDWQRHNLVFNSGTCYILSRESLRRLAIRLGSIESSRAFTYQCGDGAGAREDPHTAGCLRDVGVLASNSLDANGKQRFLTFRPQDHLFRMKAERSWFWTGKDRSKDLLDCCSNYPISFHNFKSYPRAAYEPEAYYMLEYFLSAHKYEAILKAMDPPSQDAQRFRVPEDLLSLHPDEDRNIPGFRPEQKLNHWLTVNPDKAACVLLKDQDHCKCKIPEVLPHLTSGVMLIRDEGDKGEEGEDCSPGSPLSTGGRCKLKCKEGYFPVASSSSWLGGGGGGGGEKTDDDSSVSPSYVTCPDGALLYPEEPLRCKMRCKKASLDDIRRKVEANGDSVVQGLDGARIRCGKGRAMIDGKVENTLSCGKDIKEEDLSSYRCAPCVRWTVNLSGSSYTHDSWKAITVDGNTESKFEVASVKTGSKWDPNKNCQQWHRETQLILRVRGREAPIRGLSCGNQLIQIGEIKKEEGICKSR